MQPFARLDGLVAPLARANVDTDAIIPKQFLKSVRRNGFGPNLFDELRYLDRGEPGQDCSKRPLNPDFPLNESRYRGAQILLTRENFGCGSSREHAVWALGDAGFRVLIAPSFADIFYGNCFKNGLLPIVFDSTTIDALFEAVDGTMGCCFIVDLTAQTLTTGEGATYGFNVDPFRRHCLLNGLDDIALTLGYAAEIRAYEARRGREVPWLFM